MKKFLALIALITITLGVSSFTAASEGVAVKIKKGKMAINGKVVTSDWSLTGYKSVLGEPERSREGYNKTHTYDAKSIVLFEKMADKVATGTVSEAQFYYYVPEANNVTPKGQFSGTIKIDKLVVSRNLTSKVMLAKLKKWTKTDSYIEHSYRMASNGLYIYFQFNDAEDGLVKISVGPDKRDK